MLELWLVGEVVIEDFFFSICVIWNDPSLQKYGLSQTFLLIGTRGGVDFL